MVVRATGSGRSTSALDAYVAELYRSLIGPGRRKRDVLTEVRDHLEDAATAYRDSGMDAASADRRAVTDFGPVEALAPEFQGELGLAQGRRTALLAFAVLLAQPVLWQSAWPWMAEGSDQPVGGFVAVVDFAMESLGGTAIGLCALAVLACGVGTRHPVARAFAARATAVLALACCVVFPVLGVLLSTQSPGPVPLSLTWVGLLLVLPLTAVAASARRCVRACWASG